MPLELTKLLQVLPEPVCRTLASGPALSLHGTTLLGVIGYKSRGMVCSGTPAKAFDTGDKRLGVVFEQQDRLLNKHGSLSRDEPHIPKRCTTHTEAFHPNESLFTTALNRCRKNQRSFTGCRLPAIPLCLRFEACIKLHECHECGLGRVGWISAGYDSAACDQETITLIGLLMEGVLDLLSQGFMAHFEEGLVRENQRGTSTSSLCGL